MRCVDNFSVRGDLSAIGGSEGRIGDDGKIAFPIIEELSPSQSATFTIEVEGALPGAARLRAEVRAPHLTHALSEEQSTRVIDRR